MRTSDTGHTDPAETVHSIRHLVGMEVDTEIERESLNQQTLEQRKVFAKVGYEDTRIL